jgi:hypothetical protein
MAEDDDEGGDDVIIIIGGKSYAPKELTPKQKKQVKALLTRPYKRKEKPE